MGKEILYLKTKLLITEEEKNKNTIINHFRNATFRGFNLILNLGLTKYDVTLGL